MEKLNINNNYKPTLELLETRFVPYVLSGQKWASANVSASFMPDGTITDNSAPSSLFAMMNAVAPTVTWEREFARALQTWADVSPLNFHFVADSGAAAGSTGNVQGNSNFGDIRLGARSRTDGFVAFSYYPSNFSTLGGDEFFNPGYTFHIGTYLDFYSTALHESGHAIGLAHSLLSTAVMYYQITGVYTGLTADDIAGVQAIYGARQPDVYDAVASNDTINTATQLSTKKARQLNISADLTSMSDLDYYQMTVPAETNGNATITLDASQLSLLEGKISVYDGAGNLLGSAVPTTYGQVVTLNVTGLAVGSVCTVEVSGATSDVFGMGAYKLSILFNTSVRHIFAFDTTNIVVQPNPPTDMILTPKQTLHGHVFNDPGSHTSIFYLDHYFSKHYCAPVDELWLEFKEDFLIPLEIT